MHAPADAFVVYLRASLGRLTARVDGSAWRPWFSDDPAATLERLYEGRESLDLKAADLALDVDGVLPSDLAARIVASVN